MSSTSSTSVAPSTSVDDTDNSFELTKREIEEIESEIGNQVDINAATRVVANELLKYIII